MAYCNLCNKKIGFLDNSYPKFPGDSVGVCMECSKFADEKVTPIVKQMALELKSSIEITNVIIHKYPELERNKLYIKRYVEYVLAEVYKKDSQMDELNRKCSEIMLTTGYSFDGYKITEYHAVISGEVAVGPGFFSETIVGISDISGIISGNYSEKMRTAKEAVLEQLKMRAVMIGANAIISVDFDYLTFADNIIGISANGTAVQIEKENN